ncbi:hypothetical protein SRHO_G00170390 [Serrasalmus rhombeus]
MEKVLREPDPQKTPSNDKRNTEQQVRVDTEKFTCGVSPFSDARPRRIPCRRQKNDARRESGDEKLKSRERKAMGTAVNLGDQCERPCRKYSKHFPSRNIRKGKNAASEADDFENLHLQVSSKINTSVTRNRTLLALMSLTDLRAWSVLL